MASRRENRGRRWRSRRAGARSIVYVEIARAFLVSEPAVGKRIVRAKRKIADPRIPYRVPADEDLPDRLRLEVPCA